MNHVRRGMAAVIGAVIGSIAAIAGAPRVAATAAAGVGARITLDTVACPRVAEPALRRIIGIELGELLLPLDGDVPLDTDRLTLTCVGDSARLVATSAIRGERLERQLDLAEFPADAAPRVVALAAIEILSVLDSEVRRRVVARATARVPSAPTESSPPASQTPTATPPAAAVVARPERPSPPRAASAPTSRATTIGASAVWRTFVAPGPSLWGGKVEIAQALERRWELDLDGELVAGNRQVPLGTATSTLASVATSFGLRFGERAQAPRLGGFVGIGGRLGVVRLSGQAMTANVVEKSTLRAWGGPAVSGHVVAGGDRLSVKLAAEAGFGLGRTQGLADGANVLEVGGPWLALSLGAGIRF